MRPFDKSPGQISNFISLPRRTMKKLFLSLFLVLQFSPLARGEWTSLENELKEGKGEITQAGDSFRAGGAHVILGNYPAPKEKEYVATVNVKVPEGEQKESSSAAIAFFGPAPHKERLYAMLITKAPNLKKNRGTVAIWHNDEQLSSFDVPIIAGKSYMLAASFSEIGLRLGIAPAEDAASIRWMTDAPINDFEIAGVGVRTYAQAFDFDHFKVISRDVMVTRLKNDQQEVTLNEHGAIWAWKIRRGGQWETVAVRHDQYCGPMWVLDGTPVASYVAKKSQDSALLRSDTFGKSNWLLLYKLDGPRLVINARIDPSSPVDAPISQVSLRLGIDTSMEKYPDWNDRYFPTLLRCEKTHFWGYFMSPKGKIIAIGSPQPIASWHLDYKQYQHRIYTATLDLINRDPVPERHNKDGTSSATIYLQPVDTLADVKPTLAKLLDAPMIDCDRYTVAAGEKIQVRVVGSEPQTFDPGNQPGQFKYVVNGTGGRMAEAVVSVRQPWSWYLKAARAEAISKPQKGTSHTESWYGLFSCFEAQRLFPDSALDHAALDNFNEIWPLMFDPEKMVPINWQNRIQNSACAAGLMTAKYKASHDIHDLEFAVSLADFVISKQSADGAYRNGKTHYTSVVYIAKSIMELMAEEKKLASTDPKWQERYDRHYTSVKRAMDELAKSLDNIETEGEMTFEDGMISCSYTQLAMFALLQTDPAERKKYLDAAVYLCNGHRCLSQIIVPDSRMNGGSLRFWEAQYDVMAKPNMTSSPHGWSAWRIYGLWYLYQLTGEPDYLRQTMNALGSCVQLIDSKTGELRWAFVVDPCIKGSLFKPDGARAGYGRSEPAIIGEQYIPMISGWYQPAKNTFVGGYLAMGGPPGGSCDNDVHEIFKCLAEVAVTSCYVIETADGKIETWNCTAKQNGDVLEITPAEACVTSVHVNMKHLRKIEAKFLDRSSVSETVEGMKWVRATEKTP